MTWTAAPIGRALVALLGVAVLVLALAPADPAGATHTFPRKLTISYDNGKFKGKFKSPAAECRGGIVAVRKRVRGGPDPVVATDVANDAGKWSARERGARGRYYASADSFLAPSGRCPDVRSGLVKA